MWRTLVMLAAIAMGGAGMAVAQEHRTGAGGVEIAAIPVGGVMFVESSNGAQPKFRNYVFGASVTGNVTNVIGIESDVNFAVGRRQDLTFNGGVLSGQKTPNLWSYTADLIVNVAGSDRPVVPYAAVGAGGLTLLNTPAAANLGLTTSQTYFTSNVGGGVRWFPMEHWGLRADYRYFMVHNRADAPAFFGLNSDRHAHRVYGSIILTF